jgi:hypothetical protein
MDREVKNFEEIGSMCISVHEGQAKLWEEHCVDTTGPWRNEILTDYRQCAHGL